METPDFDQIERLAVAGKPESFVQHSLRVKLADWPKLLWEGWRVKSWSEVREIACHRQARRILSTTEHNSHA